MRQRKPSIFWAMLILTPVFITGCRDGSTGPATTEQSFQVASINPVQGKYGTEITIHGNDFGDDRSALSVAINGVSAEIVSAGPATITARIPKGAGTGPVRVNRDGQTAEGPYFNYILTINVTTLAGTGTLGFRDGPGEQAQFNYPVGLDLMPNGNLAVVDYWNHSIRMVTPGGNVSTLAGNGEPGLLDGLGPTARFFRPIDVEAGNDGSIYVTDFGNHLIRHISPTGNVITFSGTAQGYYDGPPLQARFNFPAGIAQAESDTFFISDSGNNRIRWVAPDGTVGTFAGSGTNGFENGYGLLATFSLPFGLDLGDRQRIYIAEYGNNSIRLISSQQVVSTFSGSGEAGYVDDHGDEAQFNAPYDVEVVDSKNVVYVADYYNHRIRRISSQRNVTNIAGDGTPGFVDGDETQARFDRPIGLAVNAEGTVLYVADHFNHAIRKVTIE